MIYSEPLKVQSFKLNNSKFMIVSTQITNTEIFAFIVVLVFKLLRLNVFFINTKRQKKQLKSKLLLKKIANLTGKLNSGNTILLKFVSGHQCFFNLHDLSLTLRACTVF